MAVIISEQDMNILYDLINVSLFRGLDFEKLYELELKGAKSTEEYRKAVKNLNAKDIRENNLMEELISKDAEVSSIERISSLIQIFLSKEESSETFIDVILLQKKCNTANRRTINLLATTASFSKESLMEMKDPIELALAEFKGIDIDFVLESEERLGNSVLELSKVLTEKVYLFFLILLQESIDDKSLSSLRNQLLKVKYDFIFMNPMLDSDILLADFNQKLPYIPDPLSEAGDFELDEEMIRECINITALRQLNEKMRLMTKIKDKDYHNLDNNKMMTAMVSSVLISNYIKAWLMAVESDQEVLDEIKNLFNSVIETNGENNHISTSVLKEIKREFESSRII